jgi:hypothetical protein
VIAVAVGGIGALIMAPFTQQGLVTHLGFGMLGTLWLFTTLMAYVRIRSGDQEAHQRWMTRSYALTLAAVTLRVYMMIGIGAGIPFRDAYRVISWLCWVPNIVAAELINKGRRRQAAVVDRQQAAA